MNHFRSLMIHHCSHRRFRRDLRQCYPYRGSVLPDHLDLFRSGFDSFLRDYHGDAFAVHLAVVETRLTWKQRYL
jgi:hypothetical protein